MKIRQFFGYTMIIIIFILVPLAMFCIGTHGDRRMIL